MADIIGLHPWRDAIIEVISSDLSIEITEDDSDWEYLDGEMVKLGSLEHQLLDIAKIQQCAIHLLSTKTKDMRVLAHLLRTLQHSGQFQEVILAAVLLSDYIKVYWEKAAPNSLLKKNRLTLQILKRFEPVLDNFCQQASRYEREALLEQFVFLSSIFTDRALIELLDHYCQRLQSKLVSSEQVQHIPEPTLLDDASSSISSSLVETKINVDDSNEKAWRYTLLKVADILVSKNRALPIGYQLRRHAIWSGIDALPPADNYITPLAAVSSDMRQKYLSYLKQPTLEIWAELEYSLTLAPFWIEGHFISAKYAEGLGYLSVADAIKVYTETFLSNLPELIEFHFNDGLPFVSEETKHWLSEPKEVSIELEQMPMNFSDIWDSYQSEGLTIALEKLNSIPTNDRRDKFYVQLTACKLLEQANMVELAQQNYHTMQKALLSISIEEWENSLFTFLTQKTSQ